MGRRASGSVHVVRVRSRHTVASGETRANCRACHATFDDEALFDAHRLTGAARPLTLT